VSQPIGEIEECGFLAFFRFETASIRSTMTRFALVRLRFASA